ncbi:MAG: RDD family protein [Streptococcaceae bacterium]|jgi:uncharacterized RDD family membrane protein YckC|nr:RDD family protein [Streptococcaceae bacterium]
MKNLLYLIQRILAAVIDLICIYLPVLFLTNIVLKQSSSLANFLAAILFCTYNLIAVSSFDGMTLGKYFAKLRVKSISKSFMELGQREFAKLLYFLPFAGLVFLLVSLILYFVKGKFLHDWIGQSEVNLWIQA